MPAIATGTQQALQGTFNSAGMAVQDIFNAKAQRIMAGGYRESAGSYDVAAKLARENADITRESTRLSLDQADRQIYKTIGGQQADVAGAGFSASGTALDLLRDSEAQGKLTLDLITKQGEINANAYEAQASMYEGQAALSRSQADAADTSADYSDIAAYIHGASAVVSLGGFLPG